MPVIYFSKVFTHVLVSLIIYYYYGTKTPKRVRLTTSRQVQVSNIVLIFFLREGGGQIPDYFLHGANDFIFIVRDTEAYF